MVVSVNGGLLQVHPGVADVYIPPSRAYLLLISKGFTPRVYAPYPFTYPPFPPFPLRPGSLTCDILSFCLLLPSLYFDLSSPSPPCAHFGSTACVWPLP